MSGGGVSDNGRWDVFKRARDFDDTGASWTERHPPLESDYWSLKYQIAQIRAGREKATPAELARLIAERNLIHSQLYHFGGDLSDSELAMNETLRARGGWTGATP